MQLMLSISWIARVMKRGFDPIGKLNKRGAIDCRNKVSRRRQPNGTYFRSVGLILEAGFSRFPNWTSFGRFL